MPNLGRKRQSTLQRSGNSKKNKSDQDDEEFDGHSLFCKFMKQCGVVLSNGNTAVKLNDAPTTIIKKLNKKIRAHDDYPDVIDDVLSGFEEYIDDKNRFIRSMHNTEQNTETGQFQIHDTFIKVLLQSEELQQKVACAVIDKLSDYIETEFVTLEVLGTGLTESRINVPQLLINQFRWLTFYKNSLSIFKKLMEMVYLMPYQTASLIISSIPEIVSDKDHDEVAIKLKELLNSNSILTVIILDAFTSLNCSKMIQDETVQSAFSCLKSVKVDELPIVIKFILKTITPNNASDRLSKLRQNLDLTIIKNPDICLLITETLFSAIQYQSGVADGLLSILESVGYDEFTPTDFVFIILVCTTFKPSHKKTAITFLKTKLQSKSLSDRVINISYKKCTKILETRFETLHSLCNVFINSFSENLKQIVFQWCMLMFEHFNDFCQQEIVGSLVQHVGSLNSNVIDVVLKIFMELSKNHLTKFCRYSLFIWNIIEHVENLSYSQIRFVYEVLSYLSFSDEGKKVSGLEDELNILIKKQLSHSSVRFQCIGVIGAVSMFSVLAQKSHKVEITSHKLYYNTAKSMLKLLHDVTASNYKIQALYLDELSLTFQRAKVNNIDLDKKLCSQLKKVLQAEFTDTFMIENGEGSSNSSVLLPSAKIYGIGNTKEHVKIMPSTSHSNVVILNPLFAALSSVADADFLNEILLAKILTYEVRTLDNFKELNNDQKFIFLDSLFYCVNWLIEVVNNLTGQNECSNQSIKVIAKRISHIIAMKNMLDNFSLVVDDYELPNVLNNLFAHKKIPQKGLRNSNISQNSSTTDGVDASTQDDDLNKTTTSKKKKPMKKDKKKSSIAKNLCQFREFSPCLIDLLKCSLQISGSSNESNATIKPKHLLLLSKDFLEKCKHKLVSYTKAKKTFPFQSKIDSTRFQKLDLISESSFGEKSFHILPSLLDHIETILSFLENDEEIESIDDMSDLTLIKQCYDTLMDIFKHVILWQGNHQTEEKTKNILAIICMKYGTHPSDDLKSHFSSTVQYFSYISDTLPNLKTAYCLVETVSTLLDIVEDHDFCNTQNVSYLELKNKICEIVIKFLSNDWSNCDLPKEVKINDILEHLLNTYFKLHSETLEGVQHILEKSVCPLLEETGNGCDFPCVTKSNVHIVYSCAMNALTKSVKQFPLVKAGFDESQGLDVLLRWNEGNKILTVLTKLLKGFPSKSILIAAVKYGRIYVDQFIKTALPSCEYLFAHDQDSVIGVLKSLQVATRQLQHLTTHSKVTKDIVLSKNVPQLKMCLEKLIFQVKGLLAQHKCTEAFWLGNLKNRDLDGEEILTQHDSEEISQNIDVDESYSESY